MIEVSMAYTATGIDDQVVVKVTHTATRIDDQVVVKGYTHYQVVEPKLRLIMSIG